MVSTPISSAVPLILSAPAWYKITSMLSIPVSPLLKRPSLSLSSQTKLPMLNKRIRPKSMDRLVLLSVSSSSVGSVYLNRFMVSDIIISVSLTTICVPSSSLLSSLMVLVLGSKVAVWVPSSPVPVELYIFSGVPLFILT